MRAGIAVGLCLVVVLAGCVGSPGGGSPAPGTAGSETSTERSAARTATATPTGTTATATPARPPDATRVNTIDYADLSDRQREAFHDALDGEVTFGPSSPAIDTDYRLRAAYVFRGYDYVRDEGRYYRLELHESSLRFTSYTYVLRPDTPGPDDPVIGFENLSDDAQRKVRAAITGRYTTPYRAGTGHPDVFQSTYIRYENETYRPQRRMIREKPEISLRVTEYGDGTDDQGTDTGS